MNIVIHSKMPPKRDYKVSCKDSKIKISKLPQNAEIKFICIVKHENEYTTGVVKSDKQGKVFLDIALEGDDEIFFRPIKKKYDWEGIFHFSPNTGECINLKYEPYMPT